MGHTDAKNCYEAQMLFQLRQPLGVLALSFLDRSLHSASHDGIVFWIAGDAGTE
jgi:hypothetical protein